MGRHLRQMPPRIEGQRLADRIGRHLSKMSPLNVWLTGRHSADEAAPKLDAVAAPK